MDIYTSTTWLIILLVFAGVPVMKWEVTQKHGVRFDRTLGRIVIRKPGLYFIYGQMFIKSKTEMTLGHCIRIGGYQDKMVSRSRPILCSETGSNYEGGDTWRNINTNLVSGIARLNKWDTVLMTVRMGNIRMLSSNMMRVIPDGNSTFFGAFRI